MVEKLKVHLRFEQLVSQILRANGFIIAEHEILEPEKGYDFLATREEGTFAIEVKYYRTASPQVALLKAAAGQLFDAISNLPGIRGMLIVSCETGPVLRASLERVFGLIVVDRADLRNWVNNAPELADSLTAILEIDEIATRMARGRNVKNSLRITPKPDIQPILDVKGYVQS